MANQKTVERKTATFECELNKPNLANVQWCKNGQPIVTADAHYKIVSEDVNYSLMIVDCVIDDGAEYTIRIGGVTSSATLTVEGRMFYHTGLGSGRW